MHCAVHDIPLQPAVASAASGRRAGRGDALTRAISTPHTGHSRSQNQVLAMHSFINGRQFFFFSSKKCKFVFFPPAGSLRHTSQWRRGGRSDAWLPPGTPVRKRRLQGGQLLLCTALGTDRDEWGCRPATGAGRPHRPGQAAAALQAPLHHQGPSPKKPCRFLPVVLALQMFDFLGSRNFSNHIFFAVCCQPRKTEGGVAGGRAALASDC